MVEAGRATVEVSAGTAGAEVAAGATVIGAIIIVSGVQLFLAGRYQEKLRDAGYILLEDPLKICIGGCHPLQAWITAFNRRLAPSSFPNTQKNYLEIYLATAPKDRFTDPPLPCV